MTDKLTLTDAEWRDRLTPEQYTILREAGTERAFTGKYEKNKQAGEYKCAGCGLPVFEASEKFESGSGWPSFTAPAAADAVDMNRMPRTAWSAPKWSAPNAKGIWAMCFPMAPAPAGSASASIPPRWNLSLRTDGDENERITRDGVHAGLRLAYAWVSLDRWAPSVLRCRIEQPYGQPPGQPLQSKAAAPADARQTHDRPVFLAVDQAAHAYGAVSQCCWPGLRCSPRFTLPRAPCPVIASLKTSQHGQTIVVRAADGTEIVEFGPSYGEWLSAEEIPHVMKEAMISVEDHRFYSHPGIDPLGLGARGV